MWLCNGVIGLEWDVDDGFFVVVFEFVVFFGWCVFGWFVWWCCIVVGVGVCVCSCVGCVWCGIWCCDGVCVWFGVYVVVCGYWFFLCDFGVDVDFLDVFFDVCVVVYGCVGVCDGCVCVGVDWWCVFCVCGVCGDCCGG